LTGSNNCIFFVSQNFWMSVRDHKVLFSFNIPLPTHIGQSDTSRLFTLANHEWPLEHFQNAFLGDPCVVV
jgi:hypothetical protein